MSRLASVHLCTLFSFGILSLSVQGLASPVPIVVDTYAVDTFTGSSSTAGTIFTVTNHSTVTYQDQSTAADASISLDATSQLNFSQSAPSTYSGLLTGSGTVTKNGTGTLTVTGNNAPFLGPLFVQVGTLILNGNYGGSVSASPSANIIYGGAITGDLTVSGTISTNGVRTLNIGGTYTQLPGSTYIAAINSAGQSTLIDSVGTATLSGSVQVDTSAGVLVHHTYTILHANGGVTGTYQLINNNPLFHFVISYDPNNVYLSFATDFQGIANTPNEKNVAAQLDSLTTLTPDETIVLSAIASLSPYEARHALNLLSGEQYCNLLFTAMQSDQRFSQSIFNTYRNTINLCPHQCGGANTWVNGNVGRSFQTGNSAAAGYHLSQYEVDAGTHGCLSESVLLGGALGYAFDRIDSNLSGHTDLDTGHVALYTAYQRSHFYLLADLIGAETWSHYNRPIHFGTLQRTATSHLHLTHGQLDVEIGTSLGSCHLALQPFIAASLQGAHQSHVREHGASSIDLKIRSMNKWLAATDLGLHLTVKQWKHLSIALDLAWEHVYGVSRVTEETHFVDFGEWFPIQGPKRGHDGGVGALLFSGEVGKWNFYVQTSGELWKHWRTYALNGGVGYQW